MPAAKSIFSIVLRVRNVKSLFTALSFLASIKNSSKTKILLASLLTFQINRKSKISSPPKAIFVNSIFPIAPGAGATGFTWIRGTGWIFAVDDSASICFWSSLIFSAIDSVVIGAVVGEIGGTSGVGNVFGITVGKSLPLNILFNLFAIISFVHGPSAPQYGDDRLSPSLF